MSNSKTENSVDSAPFIRPGQKLPNGLIALNYLGVEPIGNQTEVLRNKKDGIIRSDQMMNKHEVSSAAAMPYGNGAMPLGISETAMMQAFQQFQAGMMPHQRQQAPTAPATSDLNDTKPPHILHAPASALDNNMQQNTNVAMQMNNSSTTALQIQPPMNSLGKIITPAANAHAAAFMMNNSAAAVTAFPPKYTTDEIQIEHNNHDPAVAYQTQQDKITSEVAAEPPLPKSERPSRLDHDQVAKSHAMPSEAGQICQIATEPRAADFSEPSHSAPQAQLGHNEYALALEMIARERAMILNQQTALAEARMQTMMRLNNLQQQVLQYPGLGNGSTATASGDVAQRILEQQAFHRLGLNAAGPAASAAETEQNLIRQQLRRQILPQEDRTSLEIQAALDRQSQERTLLQQQGLQTSGMSASVARAMGAGHEESQLKWAQEDTIGVDPIAATLNKYKQAVLQQQDPSRNNSAASALPANEQALLHENLILLRGQGDAPVVQQHQRASRPSSPGLEKQPVLELQNVLRPTDFDRLHTFSSLDDILRLREASSQYHEALLKSRQDRGDILSTVRGFSSLSQEDLMRLREAFLDREGSRQISNDSPATSRTIHQMRMAEMWDKRTRELAEVTDEVANQAREAIRQQQQRNTPLSDSLERQSTLDCLAEAAEMAGRNFERDLLPQSNETDSKKKASTWEKMKKASKKANPKLGKATSKLTDSDSEIDPFAKRMKGKDGSIPTSTSVREQALAREDAPEATQETAGSKFDTEPSVSTKKRKFNLTSQDNDNEAKKERAFDRSELATTQPQTSASPLTLSSELAQFKLKTSFVSNHVASMINKSQPHPYRPLGTGQIGPTEASVPPSEVSYQNKRSVAEEGQFDDPEDEE